MADANLVLLLQLVSQGADMGPLLQLGLRYSQISRLIRVAVEKGFLKATEERLDLTPEGQAEMRISPLTGRPRKDGGWVSPDEKSRVAQPPSNQVYLPRRSKHLSEE
ncbi:MAG: hypothetical protein ACLQPD_04590 [Desulfomonilaceae bacterium]